MNKKWKNSHSTTGNEYNGLYLSWCQMKNRAGNKDGRNPTYNDVTVCDRWLSYDNFFEDMHKSWWKGATLDKDSILPGNKIYCPEYCKWMTREDNVKEMNERTGGTMLNKKGIEHIRSKKVKCIETGEIFDSIIEAANQKNIDASAISKVCKGKRKALYKQHWEYVD